MYGTIGRMNRISLTVCIGSILVCLILIMIKINNGSYSEHIRTFLPRDLSIDCKWQFDHYAPSLWETYWYSNINTLQNGVCSKLREQSEFNKSVRALEYIIQVQKTIATSAFSSDEYDAIFSKMFYRYECPSVFQSNRLVSQYIEPLVGLIRDPLTICAYNNIPASLAIGGEDAIQSKRFFLLGPSASYQNYQNSNPSIAPWLRSTDAKIILFDLGSSLFNGVNDPNRVSSTIGARWFYEYLKSKSLRIDRIVAFEAIQYGPKSYWQQIPDDIIGLLTFINLGVEATGKFNPWNILKSIAKADDFVIVKLDIDTPTLENELIQQIINDRSISSLIDEMFFEMHVTIPEMRGFWGNPPGQLNDTYVLFTKLRQLGIRMHSWP